MKKILLLLVVVLGISSCRDSEVASYNLSRDADSFKIYRRVVFYNGITDEYILQVEGYCSVEDTGTQLELTVKLENGEFMKHFLGLSDNVTYFVEQVDGAKVSDDSYKVIFKPSVIIPEIVAD